MLAETDERGSNHREVLPGNNCRAGYEHSRSRQWVVKEKAEISGCPVGSAIGVKSLKLELRQKRADSDAALLCKMCRNCDSSGKDYIVYNYEDCIGKSIQMAVQIM